MSNQNEVVYVVNVNITRADLEECVELLNQDVYEDDGERELTVDEVLANPELLAFICNNRVMLEHVEAEDCWRSECWSDWKDKRKC